MMDETKAMDSQTQSNPPLGDAAQAMLERMTMVNIAAGGAIRRVLDYNLASEYAASLNARGVGPLRMIRERCLNDASYLAIVCHAGWGSVH